MTAKKCRLCKGNNLYEFLNLGMHPHSDQFRKTNDEPETRYPLRLNMCRDCGLAQIDYTVEKEVMYTEDYLYEASITKTADAHWKELAEDVIKTTGIEFGTAIDIGGNDGTLSLKFQERGFKVINIDPCKEVTDLSRERGIDTITDFFNSQLAEELPKADIITGTNVFAHVHDHDDFCKALLKIMKDDSVFVFESPYFGEFLKGLEYSTIYHQHLLYLSTNPVAKFIEKYGLEIFDIRFTPLHGGAFRCYIAKKGAYEVKPIVNKTISSENWNEKELKDWGKECKKHSDKLFDIVYEFYKQGKKICCVSAPAKGMTQLNYSQVGKYVSFITEKSRLKIGRYTPGDKIPIVGDEKLADADVAILLAWNFKEEIIRNNPQFKGIWVIPERDIEII
jgi:2-polyprenyl-3-methyl-5-hydroxy-6-metoxy-1,4-benzoquinol methylase